MPNASLLLCNISLKFLKLTFSKKKLKYKTLYKSHEYCSIPDCLESGNKLILPTENPKLSCGCLPFEYRSHNSYCKFFNEKEDQPYYSGCLS